MKKLIDGIYKSMCWVMVVFMATMTIMVFVNTVLRYLTNTSIIASEEISRFIFVWCIFLGGVIALANNIHIKVDLLTAHLSKPVQWFLNLVVNAVILVISVVIACGGWTQTVINFKNYAPATDIPLAFQNVSAFICGVGMGLISLVRLVHAFMPARPAPSGETEKGVAP